MFSIHKDGYVQYVFEGLDKTKAICALLNGESPEGYVKLCPILHDWALENFKMQWREHPGAAIMDAFSEGFKIGRGSGQASIVKEKSCSLTNQAILGTKTPTEGDNAPEGLGMPENGILAAAIEIENDYEIHTEGNGRDYRMNLIRDIIRKHCVSKEIHAMWAAQCHTITALYKTQEQLHAANQSAQHLINYLKADNEVLRSRLAKVNTLSQP